MTAQVQRVDLSIEQLSGLIPGSMLELIQLGPGCEATTLSCATLPSHRVVRWHSGYAVAVRGTVPKDRSWALLSGSRQAAVRCLGHPLREDDLMLAGAGARLDIFVPNGALLFVMESESPGCTPTRALRLLEDSNDVAPGGPGIGRCIRQAHRHGDDIVEALDTRLRDAIAASRVVQLDSKGNTPRVAAVVSACRFVDRRFPAPVTLGDLCRHCGVAERTLEYGFRQVYNTRPLAYVRSQRLTRNRMALLGASARASISATARACGFTHMGQYSSDYRRLFGETPSMTRARGRSIHQIAPDRGLPPQVGGNAHAKFR